MGREVSDSVSTLGTVSGDSVTFRLEGELTIRCGPLRHRVPAPDAEREALTTELAFVQIEESVEMRGNAKPWDLPRHRVQELDDCFDVSKDALPLPLTAFEHHETGTGCGL